LSQTAPLARASGSDGGDLLFSGRSLKSFSTRELDRYRNRTVGFVFQFYHLMPELTVTENVAIAAMIHGGQSRASGARRAARASAGTCLAGARSGSPGAVGNRKAGEHAS
jgi:lipoprotein-releasing system ATP-binding protein